MAKFARRLVAHNKLDNVVEVIQGTIESVELPEKVSEGARKERATARGCHASLS